MKWDKIWGRTYKAQNAAYIKRAELRDGDEQICLRPESSHAYSQKLAMSYIVYGLLANKLLFWGQKPVRVGFYFTCHWKYLALYKNPSNNSFCLAKFP